MKSMPKTSALASVALVLLVIILVVAVMDWTFGIRPSSASSHPRQNNLKGSQENDDAHSANKTYIDDISNNEAETTMGICLVSLIDVELEDGKQRSDKEEEEDEEFLVCNPVSDKYDTGVADEIMYIKNLAASIVLSNQAALTKNEWFIEFSEEWIDQGTDFTTGTIHIPDYEEVQTIQPSSVSHHRSVSPSNRRLLTTKLDERRRRLTKTTGTRTVVVVSVDLQTVSDYVLYDHFFGHNDSLITQMHDCSQGQVEIRPHREHPIVKVAPPHHVSHYNFVDLYTMILPSVKRQLGLRNGQSITSVTDHLFLVVPDAIDRRPGELGWGATPGFFAGTVESLSVSRSTMTLLHELGHNLGLGHAYENFVAYSDMSTVMGYSHRNVIKMCYNAHNMWALEWFPDRSYDIKLSNDKDDRVVFDLAFYGDYDKTTQQQPVMARYQDVYFSFNRKKDMNLQTKEYADMLLIVQEYPGEYHAHTNLDKALEVGESPYQMSFKNNKDKIFIEVCASIPGDFQRPDVLTVAVARDKDNACWQENRDFGASGQPNNPYVQVITKLQPEDCGVVRSWVELKNPQSPNEIQAELCEAVAQDPDNYCDQLDIPSQAPVWKICRLECPQSGCAEAVPAVNNNNGNPGNGDGDHCRDLFTWVEVEEIDENGEKQFVSKTCNEIGPSFVGFKSQREELCGKHDTLTRRPVYEVCIFECPGTGCGDD